MNGCYKTLQLTRYPYYVSTFQLITGFFNHLGIQFPCQTILLLDLFSNVTLVYRWNLNLTKIRSSYTHTRSIFIKRKKSFVYENGASIWSYFKVFVCHSSAFQTISVRSVYIKITNYSGSMLANGIKHCNQNNIQRKKKTRSYSNLNKLY